MQTDLKHLEACLKNKARYTYRAIVNIEEFLNNIGQVCIAQGTGLFVATDRATILR